MHKPFSASKCVCGGINMRQCPVHGQVEYLPGLRGKHGNDVFSFGPRLPASRIAVKCGLWRTLWHVIVRGRRVYVH